MPVSPYFAHVNHPGQLKLANDLLVQAIQQRGCDSHYIPRELIDEQAMFNEAEKNRFSQAKPIEMYVESISNFNGEGDLFMKFGGFSMTDTAVFVYASSRFDTELAGLRVEPIPGDLIYLDFADQMFEVQNVLRDEDYRQWGKNRTWRLQVTKFKYAHEDVDTGVPSIDDMVGDLEMMELDGMGMPTDVTQTVDPRDVRKEVNETPVVQNDVIEFGR